MYYYVINVGMYGVAALPWKPCAAILVIQADSCLERGSQQRFLLL